MRTPKRAPRGAVFIPLAIVVALLIAACGGSSSSGSSTAKNASSTTKSSSTTTTASKDPRKAEAAFTACLKQHGVTLPSGGFGGRRPGSGNGTFTRPSGTGTFTRPSGTSTTGGGFGRGGFGGGGGFAGGGNSKFATAFKDCASKLPKGAGAGFGRGGFGGGPPGAGAGGPGRVTYSAATLDSFVACIRKNGYPAMPNPNTSGTGSPFPVSVESNAKFKAAEPKCLSILRPSGAPAGAGGASTTTTTSST